MDHAVRCLRDGSSDAAEAALVTVYSDCLAPHGPSVALEVARLMHAAVQAGRSLACSVSLFDCDGFTCNDDQLLSAGPITCSASDPFSWARSADCGAVSPEAAESSGMSCAAIECAVQKHKLAPRPQKAEALSIIGLSNLVLLEGETQVLAMLQRLMWDPGVCSVLVSIQQDIVPSTFTAAVESLSKCTLRVSALHAAVAPSVQSVCGFWPLGLLHAAQPRRSGRVWTHTELLRQNANGRVQAVPLPSGLDLAAASLAATQLSSTAGTAQTGPASAAAPTAEAKAEPSAGSGGMRLGVTDQERVARNMVVLPHEMLALQSAHDAAHQQPPTLGHIDYVRDSETDPDSDEDPDDDLDL